jgi:RNA recognition motif-containing protein
VRFSSAEEAANAIQAMYGMTIGTKTLLCKLSHGIPQNNATPSDNLYIKPLLDTTSESDLMDMFLPHGRVLECKVMLDKNTGQSRQIGFVRFATIEEATKALAANNGRYLTDDAPPMVVKYAESRPQKIARRAKLLANQAAAESRRNAAQMKMQQAEMMAAEAAMVGHDGSDVVGGAEISSNLGEISLNSARIDGGLGDGAQGTGAAAGDAQASRPYIVKDEYGNVTFAPDLDELEGAGAASASTAPVAHAAPYWQPNNYPTLPYAHGHHGEAPRGNRRNHSQNGHAGRSGRQVHGSAGNEHAHRNGRGYYGGQHGHAQGEAGSGKFDGGAETSADEPSGAFSHGGGAHHGRSEHYGQHGPVYRKKGSHHAVYAPRQANSSVGTSTSAQGPALPTFRDSPTQRVQLAGKVEVDAATGALVAPDWADDPTRLFISHLPAEYDASALQSLFEAHGTVTSAKISQDKRSARPKTYGFVQLASPSEAAQAVKALHGTVVDGRAINVAFEATQSVAKHKHELQQYYYLQQAAALPNGAFYPPAPGYARPPPRHARNPRTRAARAPSAFSAPYYPPAAYEMAPEAPFMYVVDPNSGVPYPVPLYYPGVPLPYAAQDGTGIPEYYPSQTAPAGQPAEMS